MHRRRVVGDRITYVGLDVHKEGIVVAVAEGGLRGEVREFGRIANTAGALDRLVGKLGGEGVGLQFCYEAGPCGYGIQRHLSAHGHECVVVAPSLIPKRAGDRVKTDRRDAASLARLHRAGELTAVWVPDAGHEAMRDLVRARLDAVHALRRARQQLSGFLLRQGCHYGRPAWTKLHRRWLAGLKFEQAVHYIVLEDYIQAVEAAATRRDRLTAQIEAMLPDWTLAPVVAALQTMRGMALVNAATLVAELGDLSRFANPRQLMAYLGLVPSEHSSGASVKRGGLTKAGNSAARRLLIEASWTPAFAGAGSTVSRPGSAASCCSGSRSSPSRSARSPGRRSCDCARAIASSPAAANRPMLSLPRSPVNWPASSGPSPGAFRRRRAEPKKPVIASQGGASEPPDTLLLGKAGGAVAVRRTLATTICRVADPTQVSRPRQLRDVSTVMRFRPAHQSMINRRHDDRASCPAQQSLKKALERKPRIHAPATWKGGHESGL
jgi:transposase